MIFYLQYLLVLLFAKLAKLLPEYLFLNFAKKLGAVGFYLMRSRANLAISNIQNTIEPDFSRAREIAKHSFEHFALVSFELLRSLDKSFDKQKLQSKFIDSLDEIKAIKCLHNKTGGKLIFITAHIGNWEFIGNYLGINGIFLGAVGRDINNPYINDLVIKSREAFGNVLIEKGGAMLPVAKLLKSNHPVAFLPDQKINDQNSAKVPFLGIQAGTTLSIAKLAIRFESPIIPVAAIAVENFKYKLLLGEMIEVKKTDDEIEITKQMNDALGKFIKTYPEQWFWMHNRWKE